MRVKEGANHATLLDAGVGKQLGTDVLARRVDLLDHVACGMGYDGLR